MKTQWECEIRKGVPSRLMYVEENLSECLGQIDARIESLAQEIWDESESDFRFGISVTIEVNYKSQRHYLAVLIDPVSESELTYYCEEHETYADCESALANLEHEFKTAWEAYQWN